MEAAPHLSFRRNRDIRTPDHPAYIQPSMRLGMAAFAVLKSLTQDIPPEAATEPWLPLDTLGLDAVVDLYEERKRFCGDPSMSEERRREVFLGVTQDVIIYETQLPFGTGELRWFADIWSDTLFDVENEDIHLLPAAMAQQDGKEWERGIWTTVKGADLMRRWRSWRREINEFANPERQGRNMGRLVLSRVIWRLVPDTPLWRRYETEIRPKLPEGWRM